MRDRASRLTIPGPTKEARVRQVPENAPHELRRDVRRDRHNGANVVGTDFALVEGDAESGGRALANEIGATHAQIVQSTVAAEFAFTPAVVVGNFIK